MAAKPKGKDKDDDDEDSPFMPLEEVVRRLKAGPMNFGMYQTSDKDKPVLIAAHKRKNPEFLAKLAKKEAGTSKGAFGRLVLDGSDLRFECEDDKAPKSLQRRLRVLFKNGGFMKFKPRVLLPGGVELGDEDEDDEDDDIIAPGGSATRTRRGGSGDDAGGGEDKRTEDLKDFVKEMAADLVPQLQALTGGKDEKAADQAGKLLKILQIASDKADWKKAQGILRVAEKLVRAGGVETAEAKADAAEEDPELDAAREAAEDQMGGIRDRMGDLADDLADVKGELKDLDDELTEALKAVDSLLDAAEQGDPEADRQIKALRKRAADMKDRLTALGLRVDKAEGDAAGLDRDVKAFEKRFAGLDEKLVRVMALREAVKEAERVEEEVDEAIDKAEE